MMSKFPGKTPIELRQYFNQYSLSQLIEINRSYGQHFASLEDRIDFSNNALNKATQYLIQLKERQLAHNQAYDKVEMHEEEYQSTLQSVLSDSDPTDRLLGRKSVGDSPLNIYNNTSLFIASEISRESELISNLNVTLAALAQKKSAAVSELRILNSIIEQKKQLLSEAEAINTMTIPPGL